MSKNYLILADEQAMLQFLPDGKPPEGLRLLVGEVVFRWADEEPEQPDTPEPPSLQPYSQRDPRWKDEEYTPGWTFGAAGCLVVAYTIMLSLGGYNDDPPTFARRLRETIPGVFKDGELVKPQEIPNLYPQMEWAGKLDWVRTAADMDRVHHELERSPVVMQVDFKPGGGLDTHFVVAEGFTPDGKDLLIIDPFDGASTRLLERYALDSWDLARAIYGLRLLRVADH